MFLRLYDVNRSTIQFHEKLLPAQRKSEKCFQTNKELGWFLFFSSELPYKSLFTNINRVVFFKLTLTNIIQHFMFLRLYDVNRSTIQFHEKLLPAQRKSDKCFQTNKELGWFLFFSSELPYKSLFTNINRIVFFKLT